MVMKNVKFILFCLIMLFSFSVHAASILDSLFHDRTDPVAGNANGKITIVEFFDYQCGHCVNMAPLIQSTIKNNPDVRVVFKEYPIRGPLSEVAARAALAANMQGKYYSFSHALFTTSLALNEKNILRIAKFNGLNVEKLKKDMHGKTVNDKIKANYTLAKELGIAGTPAFFIGKTNAQDTEEVNFVLGEISASALKSAIQKLRSS